MLLQTRVLLLARLQAHVVSMINQVHGSLFLNVILFMLNVPTSMCNSKPL